MCSSSTLVDKIRRKFLILLCKMSVFNVHFGQQFFQNSVKKFHWARANEHSYHLWKYQYLVSMTYQCKPGLKILVFLICLKFCIVVKPSLNERSKKCVHVMWKILGEKMKTTSGKFLLASEVCYLFTRSRKNLVQMRKTGIFRPGLQ